MPQLSAVLKEAAPSALAGLPSWATGERCSSGEEEEAAEGDSSAGKDDQGALEKEKETEEGLGPAGSLARELRKKVFELEEAVFSLEGKLSLADEARLERGGDDGNDEDAASTAAVSMYDGAAASGRGEQNQA